MPELYAFEDLTVGLTAKFSKTITEADIEAALAGLSTFSETYQAAVDQPQPLFRRRAA